MDETYLGFFGGISKQIGRQIRSKVHTVRLDFRNKWNGWNAFDQCVERHPHV